MNSARISYCNIQGGVPIGGDNNIWDDGGNICVDPQFVNAGAPLGADLTWGTPDDGLALQNTSLCIDRGTIGVEVPGDDILGTPRGAPPCMGAYENVNPALPALATVYVDCNAAPAGDGSSWPTAMQKLEEGLALVNGGGQVLVAQGTYLPGSTRRDTFQLKPGVQLYGGYPTGGGVRDAQLNVTTLSGDVGVPAQNSDNSYHVLVGANGALLDGFTIADGNADGTWANDKFGGGVLSYNGTLAISNCIFRDNLANDAGAGLCNYYSATSAVDCIFEDNFAANHGGAVYNWRGSGVSYPSFTRVLFLGNGAYYSGAMWSNESTATVSECVFSGNAADAGAGYGGGIRQLNCGAVKITNSVFQGNSARGGGGVHNDNGSVEITNCTFTANTATYYGGACYSYWDGGGHRPVFKNCIFWDDAANTGGYSESGGNELWGGAALSYCDIKGGGRGASPITATTAPSIRSSPTRDFPPAPTGFGAALTTACNWTTAVCALSAALPWAEYPPTTSWARRAARRLAWAPTKTPLQACWPPRRFSWTATVFPPRMTAVRGPMRSIFSRKP